ncbi:tautomerase family protein [Coralloluteibacterium stylophorae]|uniref:Tautomerase family protein n=1 Tax=Coralloluteibacterium stylophorae TaxID=1776034 RepID=A0A8J7VS09_9GAMM|nr:tautomerase family protein [Coralloluteibacterium stylophorae]MBS7457290.1 tautomerase family protein [Coralloluteibacterium stylophorae]
MPHVVVKLWPGKTPDQKARLTEAIVREVTGILGYGRDAVSVGFEEVAAGDWDELVFRPDILDRWDRLTKQPGYGERPQHGA